MFLEGFPLFLFMCMLICSWGFCA